MSTAHLNIWITDLGDACHIETTYNWYVHVCDCSGRPLRWAGRTYMFIPAAHAHLEVEVPPGCYTVFATYASKGSAEFPLGNLLTHVQVVRANCGDHVCVTLFSPTVKHCAGWFAKAVERQFRQLADANVDQGVMTAVLSAVREFEAQLPADPFTENHRAELEEGLDRLSDLEADPSDEA